MYEVLLADPRGVVEVRSARLAFLVDPRFRL
jgi:hypothetical protein